MDGMTIYVLSVRIQVPFHYKWGDYQGIIDIRVAHFTDPGIWGILVEDESYLPSSLCIIPLDPKEGDIEISISVDQSVFPVSPDSIPVNITMKNTRDFPLVIEFPVHYGLFFSLFASNGTAIMDTFMSCDLACFYTIFYIGETWNYLMDMGKKELMYSNNWNLFRWDVPGEYRLKFLHYSYGLDTVAFESNEIVIEIE
jgi:hypothetical protein